MNTPEERLLSKLRDEAASNTEAYIHLINGILPCLDEDQLFKVLTLVHDEAAENERQAQMDNAFAVKPDTFPR